MSDLPDAGGFSGLAQGSERLGLDTQRVHPEAGKRCRFNHRFLALALLLLGDRRQFEWKLECFLRIEFHWQFRFHWSSTLDESPPEVECSGSTGCPAAAPWPASSRGTPSAPACRGSTKSPDSGHSRRSSVPCGRADTVCISAACARISSGSLSSFSERILKSDRGGTICAGRSAREIPRTFARCRLTDRNARMPVLPSERTVAHVCSTLRT